METPLIIGIAGGSGSGKTTFATRLSQSLNSKSLDVQIIRQDNYYHDQSNKFDHDGGCVNFDHPDSIDFNLMHKQIEDLKNNIEIKIPVYDFATHSRLQETIKSKQTEVILLDGILLYTFKPLNSILDIKLFIDCPEDIRFERRLKRDTLERGRTVEGVKNQFENQVKPMHDIFVEPSKNISDDIVYIENFDKKVFQWTNKIEELLQSK